ncbi:hypothetical protein BJ138DRAFT_671769 [Hygrophoropsis aurantiaca]|uniref:Uncharacterized protein n=1 Tax=Hygrophoropsis aurantiaca TaxID=72124 RepID=A0ACB7ZYA8_9AGAM|nr:hypothetical protein BJ138DRAFT_671769 [Hygrophoropsis aurantiaca]
MSALAADPKFQNELYLQFSGLAILVFDYCINISTEVTWTWDSKWTLVRILFLLARYVPFILIPVSIYSDLPGTNVQTNCSHWDGALIGMIIISILASNALLFIRTWVLWSGKRVVFIGLITLGLASLGAGIVFGAVMEEVRTDHPGPCIGLFSYLINPWNFIGLACFEFVTLVLTISRIFKHDRRSRIFMIIRNDIVYTMCILGMSVVNSVVFTWQSPVLILQVVIHSVFGSRLLFSLRQIMRQQHIMSISVAQSTSGDAMPPMVFSAGPGATSSIEYEC